MNLDRQADGKFRIGNPGGPGRPRRETEADYLKALTDAVPMTAWQRIIDRAVSDAVNGDPKARDWLARYLLNGAMSLSLTAARDRQMERKAESSPIFGRG